MTLTTSPSSQIESSPVVERLTQQSFNRAAAHVNHRDAVSDHHGARTDLLDGILRELSSALPVDLLDELRDQGLLWSSVALIVGVTDTAVRKWRKGQPIDARHLQRLARLVSLARLRDAFAQPGTATAFAEWLDTPIHPPFSATPADILRLEPDAGPDRLQPLLDWMLDQPDGDHAEMLLDRYLGQAWREAAQEERRFRIVTNAAGERVLLIDG